MSTRQDGSGNFGAKEGAGLDGDRFKRDKYDYLRQAAMDARLPDRTDLSFQDRLKYAHLRLLHEVDDSRLEEVIGRSEKQISRYTSGSDVPISVLLKISEWSRVPLTWILENELAIANRYAIAKPKAKAEETSAEFAMVPRLEVHASAGVGSIADREDAVGLIAFQASWLRKRGINPQAARALTVRGDSMEPTIRSGDVLLVDTSKDRVEDNGIYVVVSGGYVLVKRIHPRRDGSLMLISDNQTYPPEEVPVDDVDGFHVAGRVMWFGRSL